MGPLTDAQRELVESHLWLVHWALKRFRARLPVSVELDDLEQAGRLGLITAALRFDPKHGNAFPTFAGMRVVGAMQDYLRSLDGVSRERRNRITAGEEPDLVELSLDGFADPASPARSPEDAAMANQFTAQVRSLMEGLSGRTLAIVRSYYFEGKTMGTVGKEHGINESRVSHIHAGAIREIAASAAFLQRQQAFRFALKSGLLGVLALTLAIAPAIAQTPASVQTRACRGNSVQVVLSVPLSAGGLTVPVPVCADLGTGLTLNTSVTPPRLETTPPAVAIPRAVVQRFALPVNLPADTKVVNFTLNATPAPNSAIAVAFRSSRFGGDVVDMLTPGGGANPKLLVVSVPDYRPFTADDTITVLYWTLDAP